MLGVVREDVGTGRDYKQAATDAFKRAAVRFGVAHELYSYGQNWVELDSDGKNARPVDDPAVVYARKHGSVKSNSAGNGATSNPAQDRAERRSLLALEEESCPKCGGRMWDNRLTKRNPRAPDFKCRNRSCDGVIWPSKAADQKPADGAASDAKDASPEWMPLAGGPLVVNDADLPF